MDKYIYWLDNVSGLGNGTKIRLIEAFGSGEGVFNAKEKFLQCILEEKKMKALLQSKKEWDSDAEFMKIQEQNIQVITSADEPYPANLKNIPDPPFCLYYKGNLPDERLPSVAIIGARECSEYGKYIAQGLGKSLGENHIPVISGMATGIDGISQSAALQAGGTSFAVLGCGVDICYPRTNRVLYDTLTEQGGIISSYPPGTQPLKQLFPPRNRIVSGLADVLVVVEARQKSGTSITVDMALEQGKDIYAVPGRVTDRLSDGCNKMIREGAHVFLSPEDFLKEMQQMLPEKMAFLGKIKCFKEKTGDILTNSLTTGKGYIKDSGEEMAKILSVLDFYPQYIDSIGEQLKTVYELEISISRLNTLLMQMCLLNEVTQVGAGWFSKQRE